MHALVGELSCHYNLTRDRYLPGLAVLTRAGDTTGFVGYAVQGPVEGLCEQVE